MAKTTKKVNEKVTTNKATTNKATLISEELQAFFNKYGLPLTKGNNKQERKEIMKATLGNDFPQLAISGYDRASDIPTIYCKMMANNVVSSQQERYRATNGNVIVAKEGKSWKVELNLIATNEQATKDLQQLEEGQQMFNLSNISSEERHVVALAKLLSVRYNLAFTISKDKEIRDIKENINRGEVFKFASKMVIIDDKEKATK